MVGDLRPLSVVTDQTAKKYTEYFNTIDNPSQPWLVWLSILSTTLQTERSQVPFLVMAHAWVAGGSRVRGVQCFFSSLSPSLPLSLKINK